jgi:hypothetical protein
VEVAFVGWIKTAAEEADARAAAVAEAGQVGGGRDLVTHWG